uniref:Aquaporin 8.3-like protein n=1 Tax=Haliotis discus hannai TaxID=42344 RepID=A0A7S4ZE06_HALDH|nr:aquaporin 8.3-like protein [Haliotis discus hannai]QIJ55388.1 aquaporin 8.1 [Haliotis discus hannai]
MEKATSNDCDPLLEKKTELSRYFNSVIRPCFAEFLGVCLFVFIGCMSTQDALTVQSQVSSAAAVALAHGLTSTVLIMGFGKISGGHFNPAITVGVALAGGISPLLALGYVIAQILGGICGAGLCRAVLLDNVYQIIYGGAHFLTKVDPGRGILCETLITVILVLTVILVSVEESTKTKFAPLAIGFAVSVGILAAFNTTGGSMNPARSFGPAVLLSVSSSLSAFRLHYVYWVGPLIGSPLAAFFYRVFFATGSKRLLFHKKS